MAGDWDETTLGEISLDVSYGYTESASDKKVGPRFLRITDIQKGVVNWNTVPYCPISKSDHEKYRLQRGDIVVARTGNSTGENFLYRGSEDAVFASYLIRFRVNEHEADPEFVWYNLRSQRWWDFINSSKTGSAQAGANARVLSHFRFPLPTLEQQREIASILGALDENIALNQRMNATLEAMARALFQSWFVDFDPVRAKLDGRQPSGLDHATAALFPDTFQDSLLGPIPHGWRACVLDDIAKNVSITFDFKGASEVVFVNTGDVLEGDFLHSKRSALAGLPGQAKKSIQPDDILFSEIRPANKRYAYVDFDASNYVVSTKFMIIRGSKEIHPRLLYRILTKKETLDEFQLQAESRSGTFPQITFDSISHLPIVLPTIEVQEAFQRQVGYLDTQIKVNKKQSSTLAALRDSLLPKLLSGEIRLQEVA